MTSEPKTSGCPDESVLRSILGGCADGDLAEAAAHVFVCKDCQARCDNILIHDFVEENFKPCDPLKELKMWMLMHPPVPVSASSSGAFDWRMAAARQGMGKCGDAETVDIVFVSTGAPDRKSKWKAVLRLSAKPNSDTKMKLAVITGEGAPAIGKFEVAGLLVDLQDGRAEISYRDFVNGLKSSEVALIRSDGLATKGVLVLI